LPDLTNLPKKDGRFDENHVIVAIDGTKAVAAHGDREMPIWGKALAKTTLRHGEAGATLQIYALVRYIEWMQVPQAASPSK